MKKLAIVAVLAATAATAAPFNGFSVGANLGASFNKFKAETQTAKSTDSKSSFIGSLFVGYTKSFNNVIAGLDLGLGFEGKSTFTNASIKSGVSFIAAPRIGYKFNDTTAAYFKLGMDIAKMSLSIKTPNIDSKKVSNFSVTPTLGLEKAFGAVSMRAELGYKIGQKKTYKNKVTGADLFKMKRNAVIATIGASYNF